MLLLTNVMFLFQLFSDRRIPNITVGLEEHFGNLKILRRQTEFFLQFPPRGLLRRFSGINSALDGLNRACRLPTLAQQNATGIVCDDYGNIRPKAFSLNGHGETISQPPLLSIARAGYNAEKILFDFMVKAGPEYRLPPPEVQARPERKEDTPDLEKMLGVFEQMAREYGPEAVHAMMATMQSSLSDGRRLKKEDLLESIERKTPVSEFQEAVLDELEARGIVEYRDDGALIVDPEQLFGIQTPQLRRLKNIAEHGGDQLAGSRIEFLGNSFAGKDVILRNDLERNPDAVAKPLFYLPETSEDAYDIDKIREADFYFGLWEIPYGTSSKKREAVEIPQPASVTEMTFLQAALPAIIYHPKYGDGKRDENGLLTVEDRGERRPVSGSLFQGLAFSVDGKSNALRDHTIEVIEKYVPDLITRGLLTAEDFPQQSSFNRRTEALKVSSSGLVRLKGIRYYIGRQYKQKPVRIEKIGDRLGVIVEMDDNGVGKPAGLINMFEKGDPALTERKTKTGVFYEAAGKATLPRPFSEEEVRAQDPEAYESFQRLLAFDNDLKSKADLAVFDLPKEQKEHLREFSRELGGLQDAAVEFTKQNGPEGLEIFASLIDTPKLARQVMETASGLPEAERAAVLPFVKEAAEARLQAMQELDQLAKSGRVTVNDLRKYLFEINRRIASLLVAAEDKEKVRAMMGGEEGAEDFGEAGSEIAFFRTLFRDAFKGQKRVEFQDVRGVDVKELEAGEVSESDKAAMMSISAENWSEAPYLAPYVKKATRKKLYDDSGKTHWRILKKDGDILSFVRIDETDDPNKKYLGSFNVNKKYRGSALGEAVFNDLVDRESKDAVLELHADPRSTVGTSYVERNGFVITGVDEVAVDGNEIPLFRMALNAAENEDLVAKGMEDLEDLRKRSDVRVETFDISQDFDAMIEAVKRETSYGNVISRYAYDKNDPNIRYLAIEHPQVESLAAK